MADILEEDFSRQISTALKLSSGPIAAALWEFDANRAEKALEGLRELPAYRFAAISSEGQVFLKKGASGGWEPAWDGLLAASSADQSAPNSPAYSGALGDFILVREPLIVDGVTVGDLTLGFSRAGLHTAQVTALTTAALLGIGFAIGMALALSFWLTRLIGPISVLARAVRQFSTGVLPEPSPIPKREDEIGDLALAVDYLREGYVEARTDKLTGLPNRRAFDEHHAQLAKDGRYALFLIDLDDFKPINDGFGHGAGDRVLQTIADRLNQRAPPQATVYRLGGDEFAVILPDMTEEAAALEVGEAIAEDICRPLPVGREQFHVGVSIGVALASLVRGRATDVLSAADGAMYVAKESATTRVMLHQSGPARRRYTLQDSRELDDALASDQVAPWLQPQICLKTGRLVGFEVLARWRHPTRGLLTPGQFMPMVEELQMLRTFDLTILKRSLDLIDHWPGDGVKPERLSINLSEATLSRQEGLESLLWLLEQHAHSVDRVALEITEDVFIARSADAIRKALEQLFTLGVRVSMDDFGTGYGSFRHLQEWDFHELKIDRRFVANIGVDRSSEVIIQGFVSIAKGLGAEVVAEGIEDADQAQFLTDLGCDIGQGYFYGRPAPADNLDIRDVEEKIKAAG
ncbi:MAG: EAL domain-containing protein [Rhodobacteraceae bacterium]|nr:EAL domain-containing protein [Paracoccaceae bacterium]